MRPSRTLTNGNGYHIGKNLLILNVQQADEGVYLCEAKNPYGSTFTAVALEVRDPGRKLTPIFCCILLHRIIIRGSN